MSFSRTRLASSSGAARTSSSSCLIMLPIRITLAGCSTISVTGSSRGPASSPDRPKARPPPPGALPTAIPSGPTISTCCGPSFDGPVDPVDP